MTLKKKPFENILGKGENAGILWCLLPCQRQIKHLSKLFFFVTFKCPQSGRVQNFVIWWKVNCLDSSKLETMANDKEFISSGEGPQK